MKKLFYSLFALAMTAMTLTSCEDVPEPYNNPNNNPGGGEVVSLMEMPPIIFLTMVRQQKSLKYIVDIL
jgi:hypothetical protein